MKSTTSYLYFLIISFLILEYHTPPGVSIGLSRFSSQPIFSENPSKTSLPIPFKYRILKILLNNYVSVTLGALNSDLERV